MVTSTSENNYQPALTGDSFPARDGRDIICVDLDGTLLETDLLAEAVVAALRKSPWILFLLPFWLMKGRAFLKAQLVSRCSVNASLLPYNVPFLNYLMSRKQRGAELWLTTATHRSHADAVAAHLGIFENVLATTDDTNLKGDRKLREIQTSLAGRTFQYAGNSRDDMKVWPSCSAAIAVNVPRAVRASLKKTGVPIEATFSTPKNSFKAWVKELRLYQWSKNVLVFVPMLLGHHLQASRVGVALIAFLAFSCCASSFYLFNDLLDLEVDRAHPRKRQRPFASGALSIKSGLVGLLAMVGVVVGLATFLPSGARLLLALYACLNFAYSARLKQILCLDVIVLAFLYTLRVLYGGVATSVPVSIWTLAFSVFFFLGLALIKRLTELKNAGDSGAGHLARRPYVPVDMSVVQSFSSSSLYVSILVLALYINSPDVLKLYTRPNTLWLVCLLLIFWVSRLLILANRGNMTDDPIVFAFKDKTSRWMAALIGACVICAL